MHVFVPFNNSFLLFFYSNIIDSFITIQILPDIMKKFVRNYQKNAKKRRSKKSKRSDINYFLTIYFLIETTHKCANFVDAQLGSCLPNSCRFWAIYKLTKFKKIKILWQLCSPRQWPPTNQIEVFSSVSPEIMGPQRAILGVAI